MRKRHETSRRRHGHPSGTAHVGVNFCMRAINVISERELPLRVSETSRRHSGELQEDWVVELIAFESGTVTTQHQFNAYDRALLFYRATMEKYVAARVAA